MKDRIKEIISKCIGNHHGANTTFADKIGTKAGLVGDWLSGRSKPRDFYRNKICSVFNVSRYWLDNGEGDMVATELNGDNELKYSEKDVEIIVLKKENEILKNQLEKYDKKMVDAITNCAERASQKHADPHRHPGFNARKE